MINPVQFSRARSAVLAARAALLEITQALRLKYGDEKYGSLAEQRKRTRAMAAYDKAGSRMFALLEASPRSWREGVPAVWVVENLSYADAVRPKSDPLSVEPPCAYGYTRSIK